MKHKSIDIDLILIALMFLHDNTTSKKVKSRCKKIIKNYELKYLKSVL